VAVDTKRLAEWLGSSEGLIKIITAVLVAAGALVTAITGPLKSIFKSLGLP